MIKSGLVVALSNKLWLRKECGRVFGSFLRREVLDLLIMQLRNLVKAAWIKTFIWVETIVALQLIVEALLRASLQVIQLPSCTVRLFLDGVLILLAAGASVHTTAIDDIGTIKSDHWEPLLNSICKALGGYQLLYWRLAIHLLHWVWLRSDVGYLLIRKYLVSGYVLALFPRRWLIVLIVIKDYAPIDWVVCLWELTHCIPHAGCLIIGIKHLLLCLLAVLILKLESVPMVEHLLRVGFLFCLNHRRLVHEVSCLPFYLGWLSPPTYDALVVWNRTTGRGCPRTCELCP